MMPLRQPSLPKEPVMLRDTAGQDRAIERANLWRRHRMLLVAGAAVGMAADRAAGISCCAIPARAARSTARRVSIATVERGSFVRDIAADGQVVAAVSPTLYANAARHGHAQGACRRQR